MKTKEDLIARLKALGILLNREVSLTGTKDVLALRVAELEEELGEGGEDGGEGNEGGSENTTTGDEGRHGQGNASATTSQAKKTVSGDRVSVNACATLHIEALHAVRNEQVSIVLPGTTVRVSAEDAEKLIAQGLAAEL